MRILLIITILLFKVSADENKIDVEKQVLYQQKSKKPIVAGICALAPTMGHLYVEKWDRINPVNSLIISPIISLILLYPKAPLQDERFFISNISIPPKIIWYFLQIQDAVYLAHQHNTNLYEEIYGIKNFNSPKKSIIQKYFDKVKG